MGLTFEKKKKRKKNFNVRKIFFLDVRNAEEKRKKI